MSSLKFWIEFCQAFSYIKHVLKKATDTGLYMISFQLGLLKYNHSHKKNTKNNFNTSEILSQIIGRMFWAHLEFSTK